MIRKVIVSLIGACALVTTGCEARSPAPMEGHGAPEAIHTEALGMAEKSGKVTLEIDKTPVDLDELAARDVFYASVRKLVAKLDRGDELERKDAQIASMLGREDLITPKMSQAFQTKPCAAQSGVPVVMDDIVQRAKKTSIVIINEAHDQSMHRAFTRELLGQLRPLGYEVFAAETFTNDPHHDIDPDGIDYGREYDGYYSREPAFGALVREAKRLGYGLVAYEQRQDQRTPHEDPVDAIHEREEAQANNLMEAIFEASPHTKVVIHVGYDHAVKNEFSEPDGRPMRWMAARLAQKTGIDPLTIDQTYCRGEYDTHVARAPGDRMYGREFDVIVNHRLVEFERGRPSWRYEGVHVVDVPEALLPSKGWGVVEVRRADEPDGAIPIDRILIHRDHDHPLLLPDGSYRARLLDF